MPHYEYIAKDMRGKQVQGIMTAGSLSEFYERMNNEKLFCISQREVNEQQVQRRRYKLKMRDLSLFCRKLSTMLSAGMSVTGCLDMLAASETNPKLRSVYLRLYEDIRGGMSITAAMREQGNAFPPLLVSMFESGEESGNLDSMADKLSKYYEKQARIYNKVKTATTYPKLLFAVSILVVMILFVWVLPGIFSAFENMQLPGITKFMMGFSGYLAQRWYVLGIVVAGLILIVKILLTMRPVQLRWSKFIMSLPLVGRPVKSIYSARFASTMAILYASGLSLVNGVRLSVNTVGNAYIEERLENVIQGLTSGMPLSATIAEAGIFDKMLPNMIRIGEETGSLDTVLISSAEYYEGEAEAAIDRLLALLEPALLIVMGVVIGTILLSVMLPIYQSYMTEFI